MAQPIKPHPLFAQLAGPALEKAGIAQRRRKLLAGLGGEVIEIRAGNGLNLSHDPPEVTRPFALEPDPNLRALAQDRASGTSVPVEMRDARAERLPFPDASFDAAAVCLTLCSIADPHAALAEVHRILRPGGQLRFFELVQARSPAMRRVQRALAATVRPRLMDSCHTGRDTRTTITTADFTLTTGDRFDFPKTRIPVPAGTHILGTAVRSDHGGIR